MCDTWVALRDATLSQNVIFGKNSDRPIFDCQPLVFSPRKKWPENSHIQTEYIDLPQTGVTYAHLGSRPYWCWGYEEGINEYSVVIGNEAIFTKTFRDAAKTLNKELQPEFGLLGMDLIRLDELSPRSLRLALPVPARDGTLVVDGWAATRYEPGATACRDLPTLRAAAHLLHAHLASAVPERP